jgi:hypothetical protein
MGATMRWTGLAAAAVISLASLPAVGAEQTRVVVDVPECDAYFTAFEACVRDKVTGAEQSEFLDGIEKASTQLKRMTARLGKPAVANICLETQATVYPMLSSKYGCVLP